MSVKETKPDMIMLAGIIGGMVYFYVTAQLSKELFILLGIIAGILVFKLANEQYIVTYDEARKIAKKKMEKLQEESVIPQGTLVLMAETWVKQYIFETDEPEIQPYYYDVGIIVEGASYPHGYVVRVGIHGNIMGTSEIDVPSGYRASRDDIRVIKARPKMEPQKELAEREKEQDEKREVGKE